MKCTYTEGQVTEIEQQTRPVSTQNLLNGPLYNNEKVAVALTFFKAGSKIFSAHFAQTNIGQPSYFNLSGPHMKIEYVKFKPLFGKNTA